MERNDNDNAPKAFQVFTCDKHKLKVSMFTTRVLIQLLNIENQKTYSYEKDQDDSKKFPLWVQNIQNFYQLLIDALNHLKEGHQVQIFPEEKIQLLYQGTTKTNRVLNFTFDCPIKEIHPQLPIDFESPGIILPKIENLANEINPRVTIDPASQKIPPSELGDSQRNLVQSQVINFADLGLDVQNLLRSIRGQKNEEALLSSFIHETNKKLNERDNKEENIENQGIQEQDLLKKLNDGFQKYFDRLRTDIEKTVEDKVQKATLELNAQVKNNEFWIKTLQTKIWGSSTETTQDDIDKKSIEARLEGIFAESERRFKNIEEKLNEYDISFMKRSQDFSSEETIEKLQKEMDNLKQGQEIEQAQNQALIDQLAISQKKENDLNNKLDQINTWMQSMKAEPSENKKLEAQITELKKTLENSQTNFESKLSQLDTLQEIKAQMRKLTIPSNKELLSFEKQKLQFDPELFDLSLKFKNDHEISMNNFTDNSTNIIYSHKPLPDSGKFMFSVKLKDITLRENGAVAFGAAPFKDTQDLKGLPGSFLIDAEKGEAYLGTQKVRFRAEELQDEDVLSLYVDLQKEWIHFSINNRIVFNDKIDTEKWEQGKTYGGIIANACERLNASFVKS